MAWEPSVFPPYPVRRGLSAVFSPQFLSVLPYLLPQPPRWLKTLAFVLLLLNVKSFPLVWHVRLFAPILRQILRARNTRLFNLTSSHGTSATTTTSARTGLTLRLDALPLGKDIFAVEARRSHRATPDECDYMGHLSNSSYSKVLDYTRSDLVFPNFFRFYADGGRLFLGGAVFHFHKEVPLGKRYDVVTRFAAWDDKWIYLIGEFVSPTDPDVVHCTSVSRYCFKYGRKTIPPWLAVASSGFGTWASTRTNWEKAEDLRAKYARGVAARRYSGSKAASVLKPQHAFLDAFDPAQVDHNGTDDWHSRAYWHLSEWETRRVKGLEEVQRLGGASPQS